MFLIKPMCNSMINHCVQSRIQEKYFKRISRSRVTLFDNLYVFAQPFKQILHLTFKITIKMPASALQQRRGHKFKFPRFHPDLLLIAIKRLTPPHGLGYSNFTQPAPGCTWLYSYQRNPLSNWFPLCLDCYSYSFRSQLFL